jgi:hypothetical protein
LPVLSSTTYNLARSVMQLARALLNDIGINGYPVPIGSASRATNVVTVQTQLPHSLISGDTTIISGVTGGATSFNTTGPVTVTYINTFAYSYAQTGPNEAANPNTGSSSGRMDATGTGLGVIFPDFILLPYVNSAYRTLQRALAMAGSPLFRTDDVLLVVTAVPAVDISVQVVINDATPPPNQLPQDLLEPVKIWERQNLANDQFIEMVNLTYQGGLPSREQDSKLIEWEWRSDGIYFVGALVDTQIRLRYRRALGDLIDGTTTILIRNAQEALAYYTAAMAGASRGSPLATTWETMAEDAKDKLVSASVRQQQYSPRRRRPYGARRGVGPTF